MPKLSCFLDSHENFFNHLNKLKIFSVLDLVSADVDKLIGSSLSVKEVLSLKHKLISLCSKQYESGALRYSVCLKKAATLPTGINGIDDLLNGGLETGYVYEITGLSGTGKTQICFAIAAAVVGKLKRKTFFIDTKDDFSAKRLASIFESKYSDKELKPCLEKINVTRVSDFYELLSALHNVKEVLQSSGKYDYRLLIIDCITPLYLDLLGGQSSNDSYALLMEVGSTLKRIACKMHMVVVVTNLSIRYNEISINSVAEEEQSNDVTFRPAMGRPWTHVPHIRISIQRSSTPNISSLTITKSNCHPLNKSSTVDLSFLS